MIEYIVTYVASGALWTGVGWAIGRWQLRREWARDHDTT